MLLLSVHYRNEGQSVVDNSGFRVYYTDRVRKYDADILYMQNDFIIIPQLQHNFTSYSYCPSKCFQLEEKKKVAKNSDWEGLADRLLDDLFNIEQWISEVSDEPPGRSKTLSKMKTENVMNPHILGLTVHGHEYTKQTVVRLVDERTGEEKRTVLVDPNYVFEYQGFHGIKDPIEIPPHHSIQVRDIFIAPL